MRRWEEAKPAKARIEIIPMIDVMMFLLVFFVLISINVIPALGIKTTLPQSSQAEDMKAVKNAVITIAKTGEVQVDGKPVAVADIAGALKALENPTQKLNIIINGDEGVRMQALIDVMDAVKGAGYEAINIASKKKS